MKYKTIFIYIIGLLVFNMATVSAQLKLDFSGQWVIDTVQSVFGDLPHFVAPKQLEIVQHADSIFVKRLSTEGKVHEETLLFNGQVSQSITPQTNRTKKASIQIAANRNEFTESASYSASVNSPEIIFTTVQQWKLSEDGKKLTTETDVEVPGQSGYAFAAVYVRVSN